MKPFHQFIVRANLPERLNRIKELALNYWWSWNRKAKHFFHEIDRELFIECDHNPVLFLNRVDQKRLNEIAEEPYLLDMFDNVMKEFDEYMSEKKWFHTHKKDGVIAYFSPEYGINESLPNYSGGLGILSGDHMKSSSDLGLPLVGIGLLYQEGYFRQTLNHFGWQNEVYRHNNFYLMPLKTVKDSEGKQLIITIDYPDGPVHARAWKINVGTITMYMLDTNIQENNQQNRLITNQLYGGDRDDRIKQEILLGIGGVKLLDAIGVEPKVYHINEGHAAFALLERTRLAMSKYNMNFWEAREITKTSSVFTTHTPVPAGNEQFNPKKVEYYLGSYAQNQLGISLSDLITMGKIKSSDEYFSMTVLGLKLSSFANGVSKLHGEISRTMWSGLWKDIDDQEVPIGHVTNGIHTQTFLAKEFEVLFDKHLSPNWKNEIDNNKIWEDAITIPDKEMWEAKNIRRKALVNFVRHRLALVSQSYLSSETLRKIDNVLDPDALTIGFARRFATYKRATLIFSDMDRLKRIFNNPERPVQMVIAGKAHPNDHAGKETIQAIITKIKEHGLEKKIVFIENYDMVVARLLVKGCDIWLNNPIKPLEASGTSGMKAALNGGLNLSILDGWWDEAFDNKNGFPIGSGEILEGNERQDLIEAGDLYDVLEYEVVKQFYKRSKNKYPVEWIGKMKHAIASISGEYSTHRMVKDYSRKYYLPALENYDNITSSNAKAAVELKNWKDKIYSSWPNVNFIETHVQRNDKVAIGELIQLYAKVSLAGLSPDDVTVQVYYGDMASNDKIINYKTKDLILQNVEDGYANYKLEMDLATPGKKGMSFRILPNHKDLENNHELFICKWV